MSLLDPKWKYTHSTATDIRKTFARARRELARKVRAGTGAPKLQLVTAAPPEGGAPLGPQQAAGRG